MCHIKLFPSKVNPKKFCLAPNHCPKTTNYAYGWNNKGWSYFKLGNTQAALKYYNKAIKINPNTLLFWINKTVLFYSMKKYDKAKLANEHALRIDPKDKEALAMHKKIKKKI